MIHFGVHSPRVYEVSDRRCDPAAICPQCLGVLLDAGRNGVLLVDDDGLMLGAMVSAIAEWPEKYQKKGRKLLESLAKSNRVVHVAADCAEGESDHPCGVAEAVSQRYSHDYLVTPSRCLCAGSRTLCQSERAVHLEEYCFTFSDRFREPTLIYGSNDKDKFEKEVLASVFRAAKTVRMVDRYIGNAEQAGLAYRVPENYARGLRWVAECLAKYSDRERFVEATVVSQYQSGLNRAGRSIVDETYSAFVAELRGQLGVSIGVQLVDPGRLPHNRYLITDQVALDIGRGYDLLDRKGKLADVSVSLLSANEFGRLVKGYPPVSGASHT